MTYGNRFCSLSHLCLGVASFAAIVTGRAVGGIPGDGKPVPVGLRKQLFVDDYIIASLSNVTRELGRVTKANGGKPVLVPDQPCETDSILIGSVFRDGDRFRMFYKAGYGNPEPGDPPGTPGLLVAYAESTDGVHWTKPDLGIRVFKGNKHNNLVDPMGMTCLLDPHETDPQHKYKAASTHGKKMMASLAHSPDGLHWTPYNNGEPVTHRAADTINQILWDEDTGVYRLYTRTDYGEGRYRGTLDENRGTREMVNPDVKADPTAWRTVREWCFDREGKWEFKRRQIYSLNGWRYEGILFGLLWSHEWPGALGEGPRDLNKRHERDIMNFYIITSRGDEKWDLRWVYAEKPLIPRGPDGSFDKDFLQPAINIVTWKDRHWIYYAGMAERHGISPKGGAIGLATLRLDGFVCLEAKGAPGTVVTKPFKLEGRTLEMNIDAGRGAVQVEVLDAQGKPLPGFSGPDATRYPAVDDLRLRPRWRDRADLSALQGRIVRLRFRLGNAKLYSFQLGN